MSTAAPLSQLWCILRRTIVRQQMLGSVQKMLFYKQWINIIQKIFAGVIPHSIQQRIICAQGTNGGQEEGRRYIWSRDCNFPQIHSPYYEYDSLIN